MSEAKQDGGPAFPCAREEYDLDNNRWRTVTDDGMTLRDYFAAKAMQAYIAANSARPVEKQNGAEALASYAYHDADAMLKARSA